MPLNHQTPFGMGMGGRDFSIHDVYRFGFNGKEFENINGIGLNLDYGNRIYNTRSGRFLSIDPLQSSFAYLTTYQFASNSPIVAIDLDGLEAYIVHEYYNQNSNLTKISIARYTDLKGVPMNSELRDVKNNRLTPDKNVMVTKHYADGKSSISFTDELNKVQQKVEKSNTTISTPIPIKGAFSGFQDENIKGNTFTSGIFKVSELEFNNPPIFQGVPLLPGATFIKDGANAYLSSAPISGSASKVQSGDLSSDFTNYLSQLSSKIKQAGNIQSIEIDYIASGGASMSQQQFDYLKQSTEIAGSNIKKMLLSSNVKNIKLKVETQRTDNCTNCGTKIKIK